VKLEPWETAVGESAKIWSEVNAHVTRQRRILDDIVAERDAQDALFGVQDLPDGTRADRFRPMADLNRRACDEAFRRQEGTYRHVFLEEVYEALAETVKWIEAIDRREGR
jgi:hypothetical protein